MGGTWLSRIPIWNLVKLKVKKHSDLTDVTTSQHHTKYTNAEAVTAMGVKGDSNPLHHDKATGSVDISCKAFHSANQTIPNASSTVLNFNSEVFDTDNIHDNVTNNSRLTCKTAGKYLAIANLYFDSNAVGDRRCYIYKNNSYLFAVNAVNATATTGTAFNTVGLIELAVNDYLTVKVYQTSGGNLQVKRGAYYSPYFMMVKLG